MGEIIKEGVKKIARKQLESIFAKKVLNRYTDISQLIDEYIRRIVEKCSQYTDENLARDKLKEMLKTAQKDIREEIDEIL